MLKFLIVLALVLSTPALAAPTGYKLFINVAVCKDLRSAQERLSVERASWKEPEFGFAHGLAFKPEAKAQVRPLSKCAIHPLYGARPLKVLQEEQVTTNRGMMTVFAILLAENTKNPKVRQYIVMSRMVPGWHI